MEYVKTGATSDTTPPPAPFDVRVSATGEQGTEIGWSAEADFESGIGGFIVLRDGQELAQVPEKPVGQYGRPLFQRNGFGDTPERPLAAFKIETVTIEVQGGVGRNIFTPGYPTTAFAPVLVHQPGGSGLVAE